MVVPFVCNHGQVHLFRLHSSVGPPHTHTHTHTHTHLLVPESLQETQNQTKTHCEECSSPSSLLRSHATPPPLTHLVQFLTYPSFLDEREHTVGNSVALCLFTSRSILEIPFCPLREPHSASQTPSTVWMHRGLFARSLSCRSAEVLPSV